MKFTTFETITGLAAIVGVLSALTALIRHAKHKLIIAKVRRPLFDYWKAVQNAKFKVEGKKKPWNFFLLVVDAYFNIILAPALTDIGETGLEVAAVVTDTHDIFAPFLWIRDRFSHWLGHHKKLRHLLFYSENYEALRKNIQKHQKTKGTEAEEVDSFRKTAALLTEGLNQAVKKGNMELLKKKLAELAALEIGASCPVPPDHHKHHPHHHHLPHKKH